MTGRDTRLTGSALLAGWEPREIVCGMARCGLRFVQHHPRVKYCPEHSSNRRPGRKQKRPPGVKGIVEYREFPNGMVQLSVTMDLATQKVLEAHARRRETPLRTMLRDVLNGWVFLVTDYGSDYFRVNLPAGMRAPDVPERWLGYCESLGFGPAVLQRQDPATPHLGGVSAPSAVHDVPLPTNEGDPERAVPEESVAPGPRAHRQGEHVIARAEHPEVPLNVQQGDRSGTGVFDPVWHQANAARPGHGNAAQQFIDGREPGSRDAEDY